MKWQDVARMDLGRLEELKHAIGRNDVKIREITERMQTPKGIRISPVPKSGGANQYEDFLLDDIVAKEQVKRLRASNVQTVRWIERGLATLSEEERYILTVFYIRRVNNAAGVVSDRLSISRSKAYEKRDAALRHYVQLNYGLSET